MQTRQPNAGDVERAFDRLQLEAIGRTGVPKRLGRRLYVYVAGHGAGLPFVYDPAQSDAALLVADASQWDATHVMARVYALYFLNAGIFDEVAVFMDCCRTLLNRLTPRFPSYIDVNAVGGPGQRRAFFAFATSWAKNAREKQIGLQTRGIFTAALMRGLGPAGADDNGVITSTSLRNYLLNRMQDLLTPEERADPTFPKQPDIPAPAVELVFGNTTPPRAIVRVAYPAAAVGEPIQIRGEKFRVVARTEGTAGGRWEVTLGRDLYLAQIPALAMEKEFTVIGDEGVVDVVIE